MRLLFDTSALVAALVAAHPAHRAAWGWLERALAGEHRPLAAAHTLAELYAVLTRLPLRPPLGPSAALRLVEENLAPFAVVALGPEGYRAALRRLAGLGLPGGAVYDALIAQAALEAGAEVLLTLNPAHFRRLGEDVAALVRVPGEDG